MNSAPRKGLTTFALVLLITGAIDSIRNLPATALFGSTLIFFCLFSALVFLIPTALVSAELSSSSHEEGGIYHWTHWAFGKKVALLAVWLQWINTMVWFPTILSFIAGIAAYFIDPNLAQNKTYLITCILSTFWILTFINLKGIHTSARLANSCAMLGMVFPMALLIILGIIWIFSGKPIAVHFTSTDLLPSLTHPQNWVSLTAIMTAFLGMELATVHVKAIHQPQQTFPRALYFSVVFILVTIILGSLSIAVVLPNHAIRLVDGVMQAFTAFLTSFGLARWIPLMTGLVLIGSLGGMVNWIISPAKGLLQAAHTGYLPHFLTKENKHGVASTLLILQAILVTLMCLAFLLMPSVNGSYWLLSALSTELYMLMYVLMFFSAFHLRHKLPTRARAFTIPGGMLGLGIVCCIGLFGCAITLIVGFIPPSGINVGSVFYYDFLFAMGMILMISPVFLLYAYARIKKKG